MSAPRTLSEKQDEKGRLWVAYRAAKRAEWAELCEREPRLPLFRKALRRLSDPRAIIFWLADSWVRSADTDLRHAALQQLDRHAWRMAREQGRAILDDPLPPQTNFFLVARQLLGVR